MRLGNIQGKTSISEQCSDHIRHSDMYSFSQRLSTTQAIINTRQAFQAKGSAGSSQDINDSSEYPADRGTAKR
jgi:hypothetical protein